MLILTRRPQESIIIENSIIATVVSIKHEHIRVRVSSPKPISFTRKVGESFNISENIKISILALKGMQVRIGIEAPKDVSIHREEVHQRIQAEKRYQPQAIA